MSDSVSYMSVRTQDMSNVQSVVSRLKFRQQMFIDVAALAVVFVLSSLVVYFSSQSVAKLFFLFLLLIFLFTKKDYFWFALFFIIAQGPGYFFADFSGESLHRLPLYTFVPGMSFTPVDLFVFVALAKAIDRGKRINLQLKIPLLIILAYMIFAVVVSAVIYGADVDIIAWNLRWLFCYSVIISFLYLVNQKRDIYSFMLLAFPMVFFILFTQIFYVATGDELINLFDPGFRTVALNTLTGALRPLAGGGLLVFFSFIFSLFLLEEREYRIPKVYLYSVIGVAFLSTFLSATRLWFVIFSLILAGYILVSRRKLSSALAFFSISALVVSMLTYTGVISLDFLVQSSWGRLQQVFSIAKGDIYSVDNAMNRIVNQLPVIVAVMKQNLLIGYGFSRYTMYYYDNDLGFVNTILMFGLIGFFLFIFFFIKIFAMLGSSFKRISTTNPFRTHAKIMILAWIGILIGYFTTWDFFTMYFDKVIFIALVIALSELSVMHAQREELVARSDIGSENRYKE